jgi:tetratricopeptide (TPR) repeat protein
MLLRACFDPGKEKDAATAGEEAAGMLVWLVERGLPEAVDLLAADRPEVIRSDAIVGYAAAVAEKARHHDAQADTLAAAAFAQTAGTNAELVDRLQTAILLAKWGATDWANREYTAIADNQQTPFAQFALAAIMFAEFLHDQEREDEAAAYLRRLLEGRKGKGDAQDGGKGDGGADPILQQIGRDPRSIRSRMHYFESCAASLRGDAVARRKALEESLRAYAKDVDSLISLYSLPDNTPVQKAEAVARIRRALEQIENEIQAVPDDTNGYNEYAWLVANTEGDLQKAIRYSKMSLVKSFDSSSYLDTLAHCQAAAGNKAAAVRTQTLALRQEPHNRTIRKNLARFQAQ